MTQIQILLNFTQIWARWTELHPEVDESIWLYLVIPAEKGVTQVLSLEIGPFASNAMVTHKYPTNDHMRDTQMTFSNMILAVSRIQKKSLALLQSYLYFPELSRDILYKNFIN